MKAPHSTRPGNKRASLYGNDSYPPTPTPSRVHLESPFGTKCSLCIVDVIKATPAQHRWSVHFGGSPLCWEGIPFLSLWFVRYVHAESLRWSWSVAVRGRGTAARLSSQLEAVVVVAVVVSREVATIEGLPRWSFIAFSLLLVCGLMSHNFTYE